MIYPPLQIISTHLTVRNLPDKKVGDAALAAGSNDHIDGDGSGRGLGKEGGKEEGREGLGAGWGRGGAERGREEGAVKGYH